MKNFIKFQFPVVLWVLVIFLLSSISKIPDLNKGGFPTDKLIHIIEYFFLGLLLARAFFYQSNTKLKEKYIIYSLILSFGIGVIDEFFQMFIPGRDANPLDFLADITGALTALIIFSKFIKNEKYYQKTFT